MAGTRRRRSYNPKQLQEYLNLADWQWRRARDDHYIPTPLPQDRGRWPAALAEHYATIRDQLTEALGTVPDIGGFDAANHLAGKFGFDVDPDTIRELARTGHLRVAFTTRGGRPVYDGRDLEALSDPALVHAAAGPGRLHITDSARAAMNLASRDFTHIVARGWIRPNTWAGRRQDIPLYRHGDLTALLDNPDIPWEKIRAVPAGQRSAVPAIPTPEGLA